MLLIVVLLVTTTIPTQAAAVTHNARQETQEPPADGVNDSSKLLQASMYGGGGPDRIGVLECAFTELINILRSKKQLPTASALRSQCGASFRRGVQCAVTVGFVWICVLK
ncbi:hypothetical protein BCR42DRAFT_442819 [Absidia repens]|uniref:Hydrophobin n=1 Tax=Absidia repens TaxID=90262 RepID=A0A1X2I149_9FUNG|nr:hypothetical protein BCR42DRAFT_442819 [Absidia repens]